MAMRNEMKIPHESIGDDSIDPNRIDASHLDTLDDHERTGHSSNSAILWEQCTSATSVAVARDRTCIPTNVRLTDVVPAQRSDVCLEC